MRARVFVLALCGVLLLTGAQECEGDAGTRRQVIYIQDETDSAWPVRQAVGHWPGTALVYGRCRPDGRCVRVTEVDSGPDEIGRAGRTWVRMSSSWRDGPDRIRLCAVVHELGHVLGLGHSSDPSDLMAPEMDETNRCRPSATQLREARR